jgi:hypothetical protein
MSTQETTVGKVESEFRAAIEAKRAEATPADREGVGKLAKATAVQEHVRITPPMAAVLFLEFNKMNRGVTFSKCYDFAAAMKRGEWKYHHQGIAFYPDGSLADGQHRMAGVALSETVQEFMVAPNFQREAIDVIDRSKRRSAGEGLEMLGIANGKVKAAIGQTAMEYIAKHDGRTVKYTDIQVEKWCLEHDAVLTEAVEIGHRSDQNVSDACLSKVQASNIALLMLLGGWGHQQVVGFIASMQQGIATYAESPTVDLSRQFMRSKLSEAKKDRIGKWEGLALALKGASLWAENKSVRSVRWNQKKEAWPSINPPSIEALGEAA